MRKCFVAHIQDYFIISPLSSAHSHQPTVISPLPPATTINPLPSAHSHQPTAISPLPSAHYHQPLPSASTISPLTSATTISPLPSVHCHQPTTISPLPSAHCHQPTAISPLPSTTTISLYHQPTNISHYHQPTPISHYHQPTPISPLPSIQTSPPQVSTPPTSPFAPYNTIHIAPCRLHSALHHNSYRPLPPALSTTAQFIWPFTQHHIGTVAICQDLYL